MFVSGDKIWDPYAREDKLAHYFVDRFEAIEWIDVAPNNLNQTWSNN